MKNELLEILAQNCRITNAQIAVMLGIEEEDVADMIKEMEEKNIILGYPALIDWEKTEEETVTAYIKVIPFLGILFKPRPQIVNNWLHFFLFA